MECLENNTTITHLQISLLGHQYQTGLTSTETSWKDGKLGGKVVGGYVAEEFSG